MHELGKLKRPDLKTVWEHEAHRFTPWLSENLAALGGVLGIELELTQTEAPVGSFSVDILARDLGRDRPVIIENQLASTDHDHLGKLLTYASGYDASAVVWVAPTIREEHRQALDWLNRHTDDETHFFGVVVELLQIDDSRPAVQFRAVASPHEWKPVPPTKLTPRAKAYLAFFQGLIDELREKHSFTGARAGQPQNWYSFSSGISGITYSASFTGDGRARAEVYIDPGEKDENESILAALQSHEPSFETSFPEDVSWELLESKRACRVAVYRTGAIDDSEATLAELRGWFVERLLKMKSIFGAELRSLTS